MDIRSLHNSSNIHSSSDTECVCVCARARARTHALSHVQLFVAPWTVACQAPLSMEFFQARILEWAAISYSRESFPPKDRIQFSCLLHRQAGSLPLEPLGKPSLTLTQARKLIAVPEHLCSVSNSKDHFCQYNNL